MRPSTIHSHFSARQAAEARRANAPLFAITADEVGEYAALQAIGVGLDARFIAGAAVAMDANVPTPTIQAPSLGVPTQFLQNWLPGLIRTITAVRKIDELVGITTAGNWEDEEVVQAGLEPTGLARPYGDYTSIPLSDFNLAYHRRGVVRFEKGLRVGVLEAARMARVNVDPRVEKRGAAAVSLDIIRNRVGFYGFNGGTNRVFGFLNDPNLPAYVAVPNGASGSSLWSSKTFLEVTADLRSAMAAVLANSGGNIDPENANLVLAIGLVPAQFLSVTSQYGNSVRDWLKENYPNLRIVTAPELDGANGGANVFYLYAETVQDGSTDGGKVFDQIVPTRFQSIGTEQQAKALIEDFTNATAGVILKRPWAVVRRTGI